MTASRDRRARGRLSRERPCCCRGSYFKDDPEELPSRPLPSRGAVSPEPDEHGAATGHRIQPIDRSGQRASNPSAGRRLPHHRGAARTCNTVHTATRRASRVDFPADLRGPAHWSIICAAPVEFVHHRLCASRTGFVRADRSLRPSGFRGSEILTEITYSCLRRGQRSSFRHTMRGKIFRSCWRH